MVKMLLFLVLYFISCDLNSGLRAQGWQEVKVSAEISQDKVFENQEVKGTISITHNKSLGINNSSFSMEGKPLSVEFIQEVEVSPPDPLIISYYRFILSGQPAGLYLLPEISVEVGSKTYSSIPVTYTIESPSTEPVHTQKEVKGGAKAFLKLQMSFDGTQPLYPGQRFRVSYRYLYNHNIELSEESLPLLEPQGFIKVGTKMVKSYQEDHVSVQEVSQILEASKPGRFVIPASRIVGYVYQTDIFGNHVYQKPALEATEKELTLVVSPFPTDGKPGSFNGAIGPFNHFTTSLKSNLNVYVGDKLDLIIEIGGEGQVDNVPLPELCCQPGFSGIFKLSDLPPASELKNQIRHYSVEMRPLTDSIKEIPPIEFSFFIPKQGKYGILQSHPIPIKVSPVPVIPKEQPSPPQPKTEEKEQAHWKTATTQPPKIEINGNMALTLTDLSNRLFGTWRVLYLIPFGFFGVLFQLALRRYLLQKKTQVKLKSSLDYFNEALQSPPDSPQFYHSLNKAFRLKLVERKIIKAETMNYEHSSQSKAVDEVVSFLHSLEEKRFTGQEKELGKAQIEEARRLFNQLDREVPS